MNPLSTATREAKIIDCIHRGIVAPIAIARELNLSPRQTSRILERLVINQRVIKLPDLTDMRKLIYEVCI